ncbi:hypothetical protein H4582DRAFT_431482 [Lactarius indigo]|nr:hypothetical protein H4582DRAFT_431482 [Lactarius indigo]
MIQYDDVRWLGSSSSWRQKGLSRQFPSAEKCVAAHVAASRTRGHCKTEQAFFSFPFRAPPHLHHTACLARTRNSGGAPVLQVEYCLQASASSRSRSSLQIRSTQDSASAATRRSASTKSTGAAFFAASPFLTLAGGAAHMLVEEVLKLGVRDVVAAEADFERKDSGSRETVMVRGECVGRPRIWNPRAEGPVLRATRTTVSHSVLYVM